MVFFKATIILLLPSLLIELKINNIVSVRLIFCRMLSITLACGFKIKILNIRIRTAKKKFNDVGVNKFHLNLHALKLMYCYFLFRLFLNIQSSIIYVIKLSSV